MLVCGCIITGICPSEEAWNLEACSFEGFTFLDSRQGMAYIHCKIYGTGINAMDESVAVDIVQWMPFRSQKIIVWPFRKVRFQIPDEFAGVPSALPSCRNSEASADRAIWRGGRTPSPEYSKIPDRPLWQLFGRSEIASHATHPACLITRRLRRHKIKMLVERVCINP